MKSETRCTFDLVKDRLETANLLAISVSGLEIIYSTNAAAEPTLVATEFLAGIIPIIGMVHGAIVTLEALLVMGSHFFNYVNNVEHQEGDVVFPKDDKLVVPESNADLDFPYLMFNKHGYSDSPLWGPVRLVTGLLSTWKGYEAYQLFEGGAGWQVSSAVTAQCFAIIAAYDWLKAAKNCYSAYSDYNAARDDVHLMLLNRHISTVLFQSLKLVGYGLLAVGCPLAGFAFLVAASLVGLYNNMLLSQEKVGSAVSPVATNYSCRLFAKKSTGNRKPFFLDDCEDVPPDDLYRLQLQGAKQANITY